MKVSCQIIACCVLCVLGVTQSAIAATPPVPRYALKVGQQLNYHQEAYAESDNYRFKKSVDWRVWVTKQNDDSGWRLVIAQDVSLQHARGKEEFPAPDKNSLLGQCDLAPDGRISAPDGLGGIDR